VGANRSSRGACGPASEELAGGGRQVGRIRPQPTRRNTALSRDAVGHLVTKHANTAQQKCPSLKTKHPTPHTLRHSCAMDLLAAGVDRTVLALWLGHERVETTNIYTHADMSIRERALARTTPLDTKPGRYQPADFLLAFLENL
jgi:integrase